ncbi:phosphodiester glycosidase family protein [Truepera radiovictrix]|uniref:phosphodiester glycosidase family protein n=1 Tax=Truepera radiovictrix TaxID=332249 RepID=UPI00161F97AF|nr:phosphodiester glycosidase family protein [Truepera radiovictrix]WMT56690.1 phosphodiester glycosidase family protein [Truepera radiovictrix]
MRNALRRGGGRALVWLLALAAGAGAWAQPLFALPGATAHEAQGSVTVTYAGRTLAYTPGLGWLGEGLAASAAAPVLDQGAVYLPAEALAALGVTLPRLTGVRSSSGSAVRIVFDLEGLSEGALERVRRTGAVGPQEPLTLFLPPLLLPRDLPTQVAGIALAVRAEAKGTRLELRGPAFSFEAFALREPSRVVVDLSADIAADIAAGVDVGDEAKVEADVKTPAAADAQLDLRERLLLGLTPEAPSATRTLAPGVTLRRFSHPTVAGTSRVDLVEIAPGSGRFEVVQAPAGAQVLSDLAAGALVGLNASYFNTQTGQTIGFLKSAGETRSLPTRNRAAIGFGFGRPLIGRLQAELRFSLNGHPYRLPQTGKVALFTTPGETVGSPRWGALVVRGERVLENKVGPRTVPPGGFVLSYAPEERPLALLDAGDRLSFELRLTPRAFAFAPEAVEAGPLLVQGGKPAYTPELEAFDPLDPNSNVNRRTTRAAVGVRDDGTVLLLTATELTAAELVPLFLSLGAESALQMDSGGSSTLFAAGEVINRPAFSQRPIASAIVFSPAATPVAARDETARERHAD